jgi:hypothetical protein
MCTFTHLKPRRVLLVEAPRLPLELAGGEVLLVRPRLVVEDEEERLGIQLLVQRRGLKDERPLQAHSTRGRWAWRATGHNVLARIKRTQGTAVKVVRRHRTATAAVTLRGCSRGRGKQGMSA